MSYRELTMIEIREVLRRWQAGQSIREIAREGCVDRKTARRYLLAAEECGVPRDAALSDAHVHAVAERVQSRPTTSPSAERELLMVHRSQIEAWLSGEPALRLSKIHRLLERDGTSVDAWGCISRVPYLAPGLTRLCRAFAGARWLQDRAARA